MNKIEKVPAIYRHPLDFPSFAASRYEGSSWINISWFSNIQLLKMLINERDGYKDNTLFDVPCERVAILIILSEVYIYINELAIY